MPTYKYQLTSKTKPIIDITCAAAITITVMLNSQQQISKEFPNIGTIIQIFHYKSINRTLDLIGNLLKKKTFQY